MMLPTLLAAALTLGSALGNSAPANASGSIQQGTVSCSASGPTVTGASVRSVARNGDLNRYVVAIVVTNVGSQSQSGNTLQSVDVMQNDVKVDQKGVIPLHAGQTTTVTYQFERSAEAAPGSTNLVFRIHDCSYAFSV